MPTFASLNGGEGIVAEAGGFGGSTLVVTELAGPSRVLQLEGRAGPYKGVPFTGSMRAEITHFPGNPVASMQVLGADEGTTSFKGRWKQRFFGADFSNVPDSTFAEARCIVADSAGERSIVDVMEIVAYVDAIRRAGQMVEVRWAEIVRVGLLKTFTATFNSRVEVEWELEFAWLSQGETVIETQNRTATLSDIESQLAQKLAGALEATDMQMDPTRFDGMTSAEPTSDQHGAVIGVPSAAASLTNGAAPNGVGVGQAIAALVVAPTVQEQLNALVANYAAMRDTVTSYIDGTIQAGNATRAAVAQLFGVARDAQHLYDYMQEVAVDTWFGVGDAALIGASDLFAMTRVTRRLGGNIRQLRNFAYQQKDNLTKSLEPDVLAVFVAREGQNLRDVSREYYGTANGWRFLRRYNNLDSSELEAGQVVFVPRNIAADRAGV